MMAARTRGTWGGRRPGAGRKPGPNPKTPHRALTTYTGKSPVLMTLHASIDTLRSERAFDAILRAVAGTNAFAADQFRIVHFSVAPNRVYLIAEARNARSLSSGARSIAIRIARYVNDTLSRTGPLWADRWRRRDLKTPADVRRALVYVFGNFRAHVPHAARASIDPYSSAAWFDGFRGYDPTSGAPPLAETRAGVAASFETSRSESPVLPPRSALLASDWRKLGLIGLKETPDGEQRGRLRAAGKAQTRT
jgi:hypothetical protein